jgi:hypothetical protein
MALGVAAVTRPLRAEVPPSSGSARFLSARLHAARHEAVLLDATGRDLAVLGLPERGHSFAIDAARQRAVVFGRQPGIYARAFDLTSCAQLASLPLPEGRHFFGHGIFSADGAQLFTTENDYAAGRGVLGVYDARPGGQWQRLGEIPCGGIGPHEVVLLGDGRTLCVANGGLLTHPDYGKEPLNIPTMESSLVYLDALDGRVLESVSLPAELFQLSIRHLAVDESGAVWFACQHQGAASEQPPLLGRHRRGERPQLLSAPPPIQRALRNYLGSIAIDPESGIVATTSPVGGTVAWWDVQQGRCLGATQRPDGCGVAALHAGRFLVSDGFGSLVAAGPDAGEQPLLGAARGMAWDNHLKRI